MRVSLLGLVILLLAPAVGVGQAQQLESFPLSSVQLLEGPFKQAQETDLNYILALEPDKLLYPFLREAGLEPKGESYGNWESTGLDGHTAGHYLTALSLMYASTGNKQLLERLNYMVGELKRAQDKHGNGYIGGIPGGESMWHEIASGKVDADNFSLNGKWVPWYNIHKIYAGLRDAYLHADNKEAKEMLIKLTDWSLALVENLDEEQIQHMLKTEYGGMNEVFADVAAITGDDKYLSLARKFSHQEILNPLLNRQDMLTGLHANTQIPKVIGFKRVAEVGKDEDWNSAAKFFWETVVNHRTVAIGGNSVREHFHPDDDFSTMISSIEGPETCNTYNMLKLSKMLYQSSGTPKYIDYYERGLYNHILASQHPDKGGFVYFTPMRPQHYRVYSQPQEAFWCCVGSGLENHAKYGELIYARTKESVLVNLFIPSTLKWKEKKFSLTQETLFPNEEKMVLTIKSETPQMLSIKVRYPSWVEKGAMKIEVNGKEEKFNTSPGGYVSIARKWKTGDKIVVHMPIRTKLEQLPDQSPYYAVVHGPIVLAAKTGTDDLEGLFADASRMGHIAGGKLYSLTDAPLFVSPKDSVLSKIKPVAGESLKFTAPDLIYPTKYNNLELVPFYTIHDARYIIYWQLLETPEAYEEMLANMQEQEREKAELLARTIDEVAPGEQQPESDHFFKAEGSESGVHKNRHWRHAHGWFSYELKDNNKEAAVLRITYYGLDEDRNFDILVNNKKIATVKLDGSRGDNFYTVDYPIPARILKDKDSNTLVTKFVAHKGSVAGGIYHVQLLRE